MGAREASNPKAAAWVQEAGGKASAGTFADSSTFGDIVVLATLGTATEEILRSVGPNEIDDRKKSFSDDWLWSFPTNAAPASVTSTNK